MIRPRRAQRILPLVLLSLVPLGACSPDRGRDGGRSGDHGEHGEHDEGDHVELTEEQFRSAGIELAPARPARVHESLTLPGTVAPNADAVLHVTPRVPGRVRSVHKQLGESVREGELLCVIDSVVLGEAVADGLRARAMARAARETLEQERALFAGRIEALTRVLDGAIAVQERIHAREEDLQRKAVSTLRPLLEADKALQAARLEKDERLVELAAERDARLLALEVDLRAEEIDLEAAANRLRALGLDEAALEDLDAREQLLHGEYRVVAPGSGVVVDRHVSNGEFVEAGSKLFILENLSSVWFVASAFEGELQSIRTGQTARVSLDAFPGTKLSGSVSFLDYHVDPVSRSVGVRITLDNKELEGWSEELPLRPGMFGRVELETATREVPLALPERALVHDDGGDSVFVQVGPFAFERRDVVVKHVADDTVEVVSGLAAGEVVAVTGTFLLKSAGRQSELGGGHSH